VERPVIADGWVRPSKVELGANGVLRYHFNAPIERLRPRPGMLEEFLRLAEVTNGKSDERIKEYAARWGALHAAPLQPFSQELLLDNGGTFDRFLRGQAGESLELWRVTSREMNAILAVSAETKETLAAQKRLSAKIRREVEAKCGQVMQILNSWLFASVRPQLIWNEDRWAIRMRIENLLGALTLQLILMVARKDGMALCNSCGALFETDGKRKVYCAGCGREAALRAASRKRYQAVRQARRMYDQGHSIEEIASELDRPTGRVRGWLFRQKRRKSNGEKTRTK